jgi:antitoxin (DNA-binding transcriptional repressor) of toxin-antitoxin stability system
VAKWLEDGESVTITRHGSAFALLTPASPDPVPSANWSRRLQNYKPVGKGLSKAETEKLWSDLRD